MNDLLIRIADTVRAVLQKEAVARAKLGAASNLVRSIKVETTANELAAYGAAYIKYVEQGRKPGEKKVPIYALLFWAKRYQVKPAPGQTLTGMCFAIQTAIYKRGLRPRPFTSAAFDEIDKFLNPFLDEELGRLIDMALEGFKLQQAIT